MEYNRLFAIPDPQPNKTKGKGKGKERAAKRVLDDGGSSSSDEGELYKY